MTKEAIVICSDNDLSFEYIGPCHHEEADTSIYPHACHAVASYHKQFVVKATGTDVFVIAIHVSQSLTYVFLAKLWIVFVTGVNICRTLVYGLSMRLGQ